MNAAVLPRPLTVVPAPALEVAPAWIVRRAAAGGWATCDVCAWPVDPAAAVPDRRPRHPTCLCVGCDTPLTASLGVWWHRQCDPATGLVRSGRRERLSLLIGGRR